MVINLRNALLFAGGAVVAIAAVGYGVGAFGPVHTSKQAELASLPGASSKSAVKDGRLAGKTSKNAGDAGSAASPATGEAPQPKAAPAARSPSAQSPSAQSPSAPSPADQAPAGDTKAPAAVQAKVVTPSFDVVRVEGDGSLVVAGKAGPNADVELLSGSHVIGTAKAGPGGDFAIVLDKPLKPGSYQLVLRATAPDKLVAMSKETAVISVPEHPDGQVLALVETPGEPSKLITVPKPAPVRSGEGAVAEAEHMEAKKAGAAQTKAHSTGASDREAARTEAAETGTNAGKASGKPESQGSATPTPAAPETARTPAAPSGSGTGTGAPAPAAPPPASGAHELAAAPPQQGAPKQTQEEAAKEPHVAVEAVEIEGNKIFVAGTAEPGKVVRVYANDVLLGEATASKVGRFLVEAMRELAIGDYIIRADMLDPDGRKVIARAAVPFRRQAGESVAAVAPAAGAPNATAAGNGEKASQSSTIASAAPGQIKLPPLQNPISKEPPTVLGTKLQEADGAVIIRRHDTLWQISRRVYGRGIRYSTIYLANQDQIQDPDLIYPGQIFRVPDKTKEGVTADMSAIAGQATTIAPKPPEQ